MEEAGHIILPLGWRDFLDTPSPKRIWRRCVQRCL
jgi:hypothetical protein